MLSLSPILQTPSFLGGALRYDFYKLKRVDGGNVDDNNPIRRYIFRKAAESINLFVGISRFVFLHNVSK